MSAAMMMSAWVASPQTADGLEKPGEV